MIFVNEIALVVHSTVDSHLGSANKNIGDAFLLVWKMTGTENLTQRENIADLSVIAFLKIMAGLALSKSLKKYKKRKDL